MNGAHAEYVHRCAAAHLQFEDDDTLFKRKFRCDLEPSLKTLSAGGELGWWWFPRLCRLGTNGDRIQIKDPNKPIQK